MLEREFLAAGNRRRLARKDRDESMKLHSVKSRERQNPDSSRVHGLRLVVSIPSDAEQMEFRTGEATPSSNPARLCEKSELPLDTALAGTMGDWEHRRGRLLTVEEVADLLHVPMSWVYGRTRKRSVERLPGYRLGKYWRFGDEDIAAWLRSQKQRPP